MAGLLSEPPPPPQWTPPRSPLKDWAKFSSWPLADQRFSLAPSASLKTQHHGAGPPPPPHPLTRSPGYGHVLLSDALRWIVQVGPLSIAPPPLPSQSVTTSQGALIHFLVNAGGGGGLMHFLHFPPIFFCICLTFSFLLLWPSVGKSVSQAPF